MGIPQLLSEIEMTATQSNTPYFPQYEKQFEAAIAQVIEIVTSNNPYKTTTLYLSSL